MSKNPVITPDLRRTMEDVIATGVHAHLREFTKGLFPDFLAPEAQDCVVGGIAQAVAKYQSETGRPIARAVAMALLNDPQA